MLNRDRWQQIKKVFHSARARTTAERSDFLDEACGDDVSMREEVDALLTADADNDGFLSSPAYEFAAGMLASEASEFSAGEKVGRFEILSSLGAGGMGQIYLAYDPQLSRKIALKLISPEFATDPRRVHRFEQEARAASSLNHPNVCVVHEIGITDNDRHFIAMEYIQGVTLRDQLAGGPLRPFEALQVAIQVGAALASAHTLGIVHRDIKPENIMLRPDGYMKVVDFGLAKLTEILPEQRDVDPPDTRVLTEARTLMGTVRYMSPEQLREDAVDERTDIWSLGIVLYEMLTGSTPFDARSRNESVALILAPQTFLNGVPIEFREIVRKALEKDCDQRYQTIAELIADLNNLKRELEYGPEKHETRQSRFGSAIFTRLKSRLTLTADSKIRTHKTAAFLVGAASTVVLLFFIPDVSRWLNPPETPVNQPIRIPSFGPPPTFPAMQTFPSGTTLWSAISPDGKLVVHAETQEGQQTLMVTDTDTWKSSIALPADDVQYLGASFSRDGNHIYLTRLETNGDGILYRLAWPNANLTKLKSGVDSPISFSPQGNRFAFIRYKGEGPETSLILSDINGTNEQVVAVGKELDTFSLSGPAWSPDGSMVVCATRQLENGIRSILKGFNLITGLEQTFGKQSWFSISGVAWQQDNAGLIISAREQETSPLQLWRISLSDGLSQRITYDLVDHSGVSMAGNKILTTRIHQYWRIWVSPVNAPQRAATTIALGAGLNYGLNWTPSGKIVYASINEGRVDIFRVDPDGANSVQLTVNAGDNYTPTASADGRFIVFASNRTGRSNIWRMNADDGSDLKQLTFSDANFYPSCSPDNQWVAYDNKFNSILSVWKVPLAGGEPVKVVEGYRMPVFSPDNKFIAARYDLASGSTAVAIFSAHTDEFLKSLTIPIHDWQRVSWLANGAGLSFVKNVNGYSNIWSYDLETSESKQITDFNNDLIYAYAWSPDYKQVAYQRGFKVGNLALITAH